ncbi:hypothetical protein GCM10009527_086890 [Actinomadura nitritigenes]|uniref:Uncharacterized protein n=1 Tax=Actinomadura nitritigenes TaxID=134602 RepID=A0ABS3RIA5_9ACTN|nr:hypothetical protein [Actinomadura nitritigenes]MBO2445329.1 hypothetical protein [Actinomadura nitritigenes]
MDIVVQWMRLYWTKNSRGGSGAIRRSALPEAFALPEAEPPFVHEVQLLERNGFSPRETVTSGLPPASQVELIEIDGLLRVLPIRNAPEWASNGLDLAWRSPTATIRPRQTLRRQINHRLTTERGRYYRLDTLNVSYGHRTAELFLHPPTQRVDERSHL